MKEFENLVHRTHRSGLKVIIDFVPNHVARQYHSDAQPDGTTELGANDDPNYSFSPYNNFYYIPQAELRAQFDMKEGAAEPYHEYPAKATGNNRFDATPNINDWYETIKLELWGGLSEWWYMPLLANSGYVDKDAGHSLILGLKRY